MSYNRPDSNRCRRGLHDWMPENTYVDKNGFERCKLCRKARQKRYYHRRRDAKLSESRVGNAVRGSTRKTEIDADSGLLDAELPPATEESSLP